MSFVRILVIAAMIFLIMPSTIKATLHSDTVIGNNAEWVDINRYITRGGVLLPLFYTSRSDRYGYPIHVICELKEVYYKDVIDLYKDLYDFKEITIYDDLRIVIYETYSPYDIKEAYREIKDLEVHSYCEVSLVENSEELGWPYVVEIPDEQSPIGNPLYWWTNW
jgi:hypothetical protein